MEMLIQNLLDELEQISFDHGEIFDTAVREEMFESLSNAFIKPVEGYSLPKQFQMFSDEGNAAVRAVVERFLILANAKADQLGLTSPRTRLDLVQNTEITSASEGFTFDEFFGYIESP